MSVLLILGLVLLALVVLAIVIGFVDGRRRRKPPPASPYVERERIGW